MKLPAMLSAVQTTPPIMSAANMPAYPFRPTKTITTLAKIKVISVIPDTGLLPTIAIALAATVVKRNAMTVTSNIPTTAKSRFPCITPVRKKIKVSNNTTILPTAIILKLMSRCVRFTSSMLPPFPFNSRAARPTASRMIPQLRMIPMIPAIAMPPIPMLRA